MGILRFAMIALLVLTGAFMLAAVCGDAECDACDHACCAGGRIGRTVLRLAQRLRAAGMAVCRAATDSRASSCGALRRTDCAAPALRMSVALLI